MYIAPAILLFLAVTVGALPAIAQGRMLLLGTSAFYTAGVFGSIYAVGQGQEPGTVSFLMGGLAGGLCGAVLSGVTCRLRGDYFALATLCFGELLRLVLLISPPFPGPEGIPNISRGTLFGLSIQSPEAMTLAAGILLTVTSVVTALVVSSPWGAALQAIHDDERSARTAGLYVNRIRLAALVYAGFLGGAAGALGVRYLSLADATTYSLTESIMVLVVVLLSGRPSVLRCVSFGAVIAAFSELLRFVATGAVRQMVFGGLLFLLALAIRDSLRNTEAYGEQL
jgi:branched-chain amino acid transport system permease protein